VLETPQQTREPRDEGEVTNIVDGGAGRGIQPRQMKNRASLIIPENPLIKKPQLPPSAHAARGRGATESLGLKIPVLTATDMMCSSPAPGSD